MLTQVKQCSCNSLVCGNSVCLEPSRTQTSEAQSFILTTCKLKSVFFPLCSVINFLKAMNKSFGAYNDIQICKDITARLLTPGKSTEMGYRALLQGISVTQGSNLHILHHRQFFTPEPLPQQKYCQRALCPYKQSQSSRGWQARPLCLLNSAGVALTS